MLSIPREQRSPVLAAVLPGAVCLTARVEGINRARLQNIKGAPIACLNDRVQGHWPSTFAGKFT